MRKYCQNCSAQMIVRPTDSEVHTSPFIAYCPNCGGWYHVQDKKVEIDIIGDFDIRNRS